MVCRKWQTEKFLGLPMIIYYDNFTMSLSLLISGRTIEAYLHMKYKVVEN